MFQLLQKLRELQENQCIIPLTHTGAPNTEKIKLRKLRYRLDYSVLDETITVTLVAFRKRNKNEVCNFSLCRLRDYTVTAKYKTLYP